MRTFNNFEESTPFIKNNNIIAIPEDMDWTSSASLKRSPEKNTWTDVKKKTKN